LGLRRPCSSLECWCLWLASLSVWLWWWSPARLQREAQQRAASRMCGTIECGATCSRAGLLLGRNALDRAPAPKTARQEKKDESVGRARRISRQASNGGEGCGCWGDRNLLWCESPATHTDVPMACTRLAKATILASACFAWMHAPFGCKHKAHAVRTGWSRYERGVLSQCAKVFPIVAPPLADSKSCGQ
jgi:hypothetical protein